VTGVLVAGSYNAGLTVYGPRLPRPGETVVGDGFDAGPGGKGANQAIGARRLGADVTFLTKLGDDLFGRQAREVLAAEGLPEWGVLTGRAPTGVAFILVDSAAENMIAIAPGANLELVPADVLALADRVRGAGIVLVQLECAAALAVGVAAWARANGKRAILNPAPARELSIADLKAFEIITPNEHELAALAASAGTGGDGPAARADALVRAGVPNVVVTLGADGALWAGPDGVRTFPAPAVRAVDTTGAGDAFNAGLAAALARGASLPDAIGYGCLAGAFCVTRRGVIDGLAYPADLETLEIA
jgi:ribokinase